MSVTLTNLAPAPSAWTLGTGCSLDTSIKAVSSSAIAYTVTTSTALCTSGTIQTPILNHVYYGAYWYYAPNGIPTSSDNRYEVFGGDGTGKNWVIARNGIKQDAWARRSALWTVTAVNASSYYLRCFAVGVNNAFWVDGFMLIDLTACFGAGNEPSQSWCDSNIPYFASTTTVSVSPTYTITNLSTLSDAISLTGTTSTSEVLKNYSALTLHPSHTYYFRMSAYCDTAGVSFGMYWPIAEPGMDNKIAITSSNTSTWVTASWTSVRNGNSSWTDGTAYSWRVDFNNRKIAATGQIRQVMIIDLTETFGAGNEKSAEWMDALPFFTGSLDVWEVPSLEYYGGEEDVTLYAVWGRVVPSLSPNPVDTSASVLVSVDVEVPE